MGNLLLQVGSATRIVPLAPLNVIGRGASCTWPLAPPLFPPSIAEIPLLWLEIRWLPEFGAWARRDLGAVGRASADPSLPGMAPSWVRLPVGESLRCGSDAASVELVDDGAPEAMAFNLRTGEVRVGEALVELVEERANGWWWNESGEGPLSDGAVLLAELSGVWRFHPGIPPAPTSLVDLESPGVSVELDVRGPVLRLVQRSAVVAEVVSTDAFVAIVYAMELLNPGSDRGLLDPVVAARRIARALGARTAIPANRVAEMRSGLRQALKKRGIRNYASLFACEGAGPATRWRLGLPIERVRVLDHDGALVAAPE